MAREVGFLSLGGGEAGASNALLDRIRQGRGLTMHLSTAAVLEYEEILVRELVPLFYSTEEIQIFLDDVVAVSVRHASIRRYRRNFNS